MSKDEPPSAGEVAVLSLLGYAAGALDVLSYMEFGHVFASAMTGNTALLGLALAQGKFLTAMHALTALAAFAAGNFLAAKLFDAGTGAASQSRCRRLLAAEIAGLAIVALIWGLAPDPLRNRLLYVMIFISTASMGVQSVIGREIGVPGVMTVVFTSTLTLIMIGLAREKKSRDQDYEDTKRRALVMLIYFLGAAFSGLFAVYAEAFMAVPPLIAVAAALAVSGMSRFKVRRNE